MQRTFGRKTDRKKVVNKQRKLVETPRRHGNVVVDRREMFQALRQRNTKRTAPVLTGAGPCPNPLPSPSERLVHIAHAIPALGIPLSLTDSLILLRKNEGLVDTKTGRSATLFCVVRAPLSDEQMNDYLERFALRGWNALIVLDGDHGPIIRLPNGTDGPYALLRRALSVARGTCVKASDATLQAEGYIHFAKDPLLMPPIEL